MPQPKQAGEPRRRAEVFLVDDDADFVETLRASLARIGYEVHAFTDPAAALRALASAPADVIVLDCVMPEMTGGEFLRNLGEAGILAPVVLVTALCDPHFVVDLHDPRMQRVINKPIDVDHLAAEIEAARRMAPDDGAKRVEQERPTSRRRREAPRASHATRGR
jgi:DNA-binding response OmpR family regulator